MNKQSKQDTIVCFSCKKLGFELKKLISDRYICENCIEARCSKELNEIEEFELKNQKQSITLDMSVKEFIYKSNEHYKQSDTFKYQNSSKKNLGIKLFNIKNEIDLFDANIANYETCIKNKIDVIRFEVNQVYEFNLKKLNSVKVYYSSLVNNYAVELSQKLKKTTLHNLNASAIGLSSACFNFFDLQSKINSEKNLKLFDKSYMLNELIKELEIVKFGSNFGSMDDTLQKLKKVEAKLSNYESVVNNYMDEFYASIHSNKFMDLNESLVKSAVNKLLKKHLCIGYLKFENVSSVVPKTANRLVNSDLDLDKEKETPVSKSFQITSVHTMLDSLKKIEKLIIFYKSQNELQDSYKLEVYDNDGELTKKACINEKHVFALNSNKENLVLCYMDKSEMQQNDIKLAVFDCDLKLVCSKSVEMYVNFKKDDDIERGDQTPVDIFVDAKRFYLLLVNFDLKQTIVFAFNLKIELLNSFHLEKNTFLRRNSRMDLDYLRLFHANNKIIVKQKSLYGTRLDIVDSMTGEYVDKLILDYNFDCFFIDSNAKYLNFMRDGKIYNFDLTKKKMINVSYLNNHQNVIDKFCVSNKNTFNSIFSN